MWILPKQLHTLASVLDTEESEKDLKEFYQHCETSLMWRSKPSQSQTWLRRWKANKWMQHLSIRMLRPSHTKYFVDAWTSCQVDSLVNPSQRQELDKVLRTLVTSTPTLVEESNNADQELFSSKMLKELSQAKPTKENQFSSMSSATWKEWVTEQRQEYSQRVKSASHIKEKESSCSDKKWLSPTTMDITRTEEGIKKRIEYRKSIGRKYVEGCLTEQVKNWSTPVAMNDGIYVDNSPNKNKRHSEGLATQVKNWSTPTVMDTANIQQPRKKNPSGGQKPPLCQEVINFPTPTTRDWKDGTAETCKNVPTNSLLGREIHKCQVDQTNPNTNGKNLVLNPSWVEQLMGLPVGWTDLDSWGME